MRNALGILVVVLVGSLIFGARHFQPVMLSQWRGPALPSSSYAHGRAIFAQNCATCHNLDGTGGACPNLHGTLKHPVMPRTQAALVAWIKNPRAPMPRYFPSTLNERDVEDVASYVVTAFK